MTTTPYWLSFLLLLFLCASVVALLQSATAWRSVQDDRRTRRWIRAMRRSAEQQAFRVPDAVLIQPPSGDRAWRLLVRRGRRGRRYGRTAATLPDSRMAR